jgi:hypothetical protein
MGVETGPKLASASWATENSLRPVSTRAYLSHFANISANVARTSS